MNALNSSALWQLTLLRLRTFYRETGAVFWTFGFPLALTVVLGVAFRDQPPEPAVVAVAQGPGDEALRSRLAASPDVQVSIRPADAARAALRSGKVSLVIEPGAAPGFIYECSPRSRPCP